MVHHQAVPSVANVHLALVVNDIGQAARYLDLSLMVDWGRELEISPCCDRWDDTLLVALMTHTGDLVDIDLALHWERS